MGCFLADDKNLHACEKDGNAYAHKEAAFPCKRQSSTSHSRQTCLPLPLPLPLPLALFLPLPPLLSLPCFLAHGQSFAMWPNLPHLKHPWPPLSLPILPPTPVVRCLLLTCTFSL